MRLGWGTSTALLLIGLWPLTGCHQLPSGKALQDLQPQKSNSAPAEQLSAADIFQRHMAQAEQLQRQHNLAGAIAMCEKFREPGNPHGWHATWKIAQMCESDPNQIQRAEDEYTLLLRHNPGNADLITKIADTWARRDWWDGAERQYRDALKYQPNHAGARIGLALALAKTDRLDEALREYQKLLPAADAHRTIAEILVHDRKHQAALAWYQAALNLDPNSQQLRTAVFGLQQHLAANPPAPTKAAAPKDQVTATAQERILTPRLVIEADFVETQPSLMALPAFELPPDNLREWKTSVRKN